MSLATLKKKTASKYNNNSVNTSGFSLNGKHRNQGYVGQTSLSRTILRTPAKGVTLQGHGSKYGYPIKELVTSSTCCTEDNAVVKSSVLSTKAMLQNRTKWTRRPAPYSSTKPGDDINQKSTSDYIIYKRKKAINDANKEDLKCNDNAMPNCCPPIKADIPNKVLSQGDYIMSIISDCANLDISYIEHHTIGGRPINTCS